MRAGRFIGRMPTRRRFAGGCGAFGLALALLLASGPSAVAAPVGTGPVTIQAKASASVSVGGSISDSAQLVGGVGLGPVPSGTVVFKLYGPNDASCSTMPVYTSGMVMIVSQTVVGSASSGSFTATLAGTYRFTTSYSGDMTYAPKTTPCGDANQTVQVTDVTPKLSTVASPSVQATVGQVTDTATLSAGTNPTGSITFLLFPPNDPTCTGRIVDVKATVPISDPTSITSPPYTPNLAGTYHWIDIYSGDLHNGAVQGTCTDANESVIVTPAPTGAANPGGSNPTPGSPGLTPTTGPCDPVATANAVLATISATLAGNTGPDFRTSCSAGLRIVLRAKEIRPGNTGIPRHDGYSTIANDLTHVSSLGPPLAFTLNATGLALRDYALSHHKSLTGFLVVHIRLDKKSTSTEALQILTLG